VLSNRREAVEQALQAHREKQPPATDGMPAAMERLGPDPSLLAMISAPVLVRDTRLGGQAMLLVKDDTWVAAGASVRPDHLAISLSDPVPLWPVLNWLGASAETTEQAHQLQCMENLRRLAMAAIVSVPIDELAPQTVYPFPTHVREVAEKGGIEDLSIFRCPSDRNPIDYGRGLLVSYEFIFQEVDFRIAVEPPFDYLLAWDKKGNHPGVRVVVFADGKAEVVPEERFQQLLADTKVRVQQHRQ